MPRDDDVYQGMTVVDRNSDRLGEVHHLVRDRATRDPQFISVDHRLVPMGDVHEVRAGRVMLDVDKDHFSQYPLDRDTAMPAQTDPKREFRALGMEDEAHVEPRDTDLEPDQMGDLDDSTPGV